MTVRRMSTARRARIFAAADGVCHICGFEIDGVREAWDVDHVIPLALSGDDGDDNLRPAHVRCHRGVGSKTSADVATLAKSNRVAAKHDGTYAPPRSTIAGSKGTRWKRRIDGTTVRRDQ